MIKVIDNFLNDDQIESLLSLWNENNSFEVKDEIYRFKGIDLIPILNNLDLPKLLKTRRLYNALRLQMVDESINQVEYYHAHTEPFSFAIFLNENFNGGELSFLNKEKIKPFKGAMVYFSGDERHRVEATIGKRFTLIGFLREDMFENKINII